MSTCDCAPGTLTSFAFSNGVVLQRCLLHEVQSWTGADRSASGTAPLTALKDLFVQERGHWKRPVPPPRAAAPAPRPPAPREHVVPADPPTDDLLTALLNARGLTGAWAVA